MEMRRRGRGVPRRADIADQFAALERHAVVHSGRVVIEMRVHQDETLRRVGRVDHQAAGHALEQLEQASLCGRKDRRRPRRHDVERFVASQAAGARSVETAAQ